MEPSNLWACRWMQTSYIIIFIVNSVMRMNLDLAQSLFRPVCYLLGNHQSPSHMPAAASVIDFFRASSRAAAAAAARPISTRDDQSYASGFGFGSEEISNYYRNLLRRFSKSQRPIWLLALRCRSIQRHSSLYLSIRDRLSIMQMLPAIDLPPLAPASCVLYCLFPWRWPGELGRH